LFVINLAGARSRGQIGQLRLAEAVKIKLQLARRFFAGELDNDGVRVGFGYS